MDSTYVETNGICLNVLQDGPADGPLVILLHGFPDFSYSWRKLMPRLAAAGYRAWAPDQRGYNRSDKPAGFEPYRLDELVDDVIGLIDAAGTERAVLVGHDWGAAVAWRTAMRYPGRISRMVVMNVPHGKVMQQFIRGNVRQLLKSWYMFFFQLPWLPERLLAAGDCRALAKLLTNTSRRGSFSEDDLVHYRQAWNQPGALNSMLNWYRAYIRRPPTLRVNPRVTVPTLLIWGKRDVALSSDMAQPSIDLCDEGRLEFIDEATHWVHHDEPERVAKLVSEFLE